MSKKRTRKRKNGERTTRKRTALPNELPPNVMRTMWYASCKRTRARNNRTFAQAGRIPPKHVPAELGKDLASRATESSRSNLIALRQIVREHLGSTAHLLINGLNPIVRGWANYHRHVVSKRVFARIDAAIFRMLWRWAQARHPRKGLVG